MKRFGMMLAVVFAMFLMACSCSREESSTSSTSEKKKVEKPADLPYPVQDEPFLGPLMAGEDNSSSTDVREDVVKKQVDVPVVTVPTVPKVKAAPVKMGEHEVKSGEWLRLIADNYGIGWEAILLTNEGFLKKKYEEICPNFSTKIREKKGRKGLFCNDEYRRPYGNTLMPGWILKIPPKKAPDKISHAVERIHGKRVALVIDDTGSMSQDRNVVSQYYLAAIRSQNKKIVGVWLYSDGRIRKYEANGVLDLNTHGRFENTHGALKAAATERPDGIILVTDEPGDDWKWSQVKQLPPVVAHCLKETSSNAGNHSTGYTCRSNLQKLAKITKGQYLSDLP